MVFHNRTGPVNADRLLDKADDGRGKFRRPFRRNRRHVLVEPVAGVQPLQELRRPHCVLGQGDAAAGRRVVAVGKAHRAPVAVSVILFSSSATFILTLHPTHRFLVGRVIAPL